MNARQKIAFDRPCVTAEQRVDPVFFRVEEVRYRRMAVSSILTFNFGME